MARRKTTRRKTGTATKRRTTKRRTTRRKNPKNLANFFVPLFFICCILVCLGFLLFMGYQTVTASSFFDFENIETIGVKNVPKEEITKIVESHTRVNGVWNADIDAIKNEVKNNFIYAKDVSVSRVLPDTVRVTVIERNPVALVRLDGKDFWVDKDGIVLDKVIAKDERPPFTMFGWTQSNSDDFEDNKKRVELYLEMLGNWKSYDLAKRVKAIDLSDLRDPQAIVEDSGHTVRIILSKDEDYGKRLQKGIENIAGRGKEIKSIDMSGTNPIVSYRVPKS